jgi:hypothetical protein
MRMSLDNRRRYLEKIFHFPCGDEPVAGALMQVILEKDSRASFLIISPSQTDHFEIFQKRVCEQEERMHFITLHHHRYSII